MLDKTDWNEFVGPNEFFAAPGDRILHREIPEQEEEFWNDFLAGRNGSGFAKIDCEENREVLLQKYQRAYGSNAPVVRSALNDLWRKFAITHSAFDHGFINPHEEEMVQQMLDAERPRDAQGRLLTQKEIQQQEWLAWINNPETSTREIEQKKRTDAAFAEFYRSMYVSQVQSDDPMVDTNSRNNMRQPSSKAVPTEVQQFAVQYMRMSTEQLKTLLSPSLNPAGPADAARVQKLFNDACACGAI